MKTLEERLREVEDKFEIYDLIAAHPPSADTAAREYTRSVWLEDGVFDREGEQNHPGSAEALKPTPGSEAHSRAIASGLAHFSGLPSVKVSDDTATAVSYLQILVPNGHGPTLEVPNHGSSKGFVIYRVSANLWKFVRTEKGWRIKSRTLRVLDGSPQAVDLLRDGLAQTST